MCARPRQEMVCATVTREALELSNVARYVSCFSVRTSALAIILSSNDRLRPRDHPCVGVSHWAGPLDFIFSFWHGFWAVWCICIKLARYSFWPLWQTSINLAWCCALHTVRVNTILRTAVSCTGLDRFTKASLPINCNRCVGFSFLFCVYIIRKARILILWVHHAAQQKPYTCSHQYRCLELYNQAASLLI